MIWRIKEFWRKLRYWNDIKVVPRSLPHGPCDKRGLLHHVMFEILVRFIDEECSPGPVDWYSNPHTVIVDGVETNVRDEMQTLYNWWKKDYLVEYPQKEEELWKLANQHLPSSFLRGNKYDPQFLSEHDEKVYRDCLDQLNAMEAAMEAKIQEMLHRLVNLRWYMWT